MTVSRERILWLANRVGGIRVCLDSGKVITADRMLSGMEEMLNDILKEERERMEKRNKK